MFNISWSSHNCRQGAASELVACLVRVRVPYCRDLGCKLSLCGTQSEEARTISGAYVGVLMCHRGCHLGVHLCYSVRAGCPIMPHHCVLYSRAVSVAQPILKEIHDSQSRSSASPV